MPTESKPRKPPRVVFSLGVPLPIERSATRLAKRLKVTRNAYICLAIEEKVARDEGRAATEEPAA